MKRTRPPMVSESDDLGGSGGIKGDTKTTRSTAGTLKFLAPGKTDWLELDPDIKEDDENVQAIKDQASEAANTIKEVLLTSLQMPNIIVLSGSGTSIGNGIGGPSMEDLWDVAMSDHSSETEEGRQLRELAQRVIKKVGYSIEEHGENIEAFLSRCEAYLEIRHQKYVADFVIECKKAILGRCSNFLYKQATDEWDDDKLDGHKTFLHRLSRRRVRDPRLKVFTTNYDLCFERAAALLGLVVIDGFSIGQPRRFRPDYFEYDIVRRSSQGAEIGDPLEGVFHLLKLHGSVNWELQDDGNILEKLPPEPEKACMIYPVSGKYQQSYIQPHLELMAQFLASLRKPNTCLIVAGFGFNDDHLSEPIISAIKSNSQLRVIVADYKAEDQIEGGMEKVSKYWRLLSDLAKTGESIWFFNVSFGDFAYLLPNLKALTPAQQLEKAVKGLNTPS